MTKIISLILAFIMAAVFPFSAVDEQPAAVEQPAAAGFWAPLQAWVSNVSWGEKNYKLTFSAGEDSPSDVFIRKDAAVTEIELPDFGRVQISEETLALEIFGLPIVIDFGAFRQKNQASPGEKGTLSTDFEMLKPWLEKAYREILLPCADLGLNFGGLTAHIEASDETIRERTWAWIDSLMEERTILETLLNHYGPSLQLFIPGMPETFDELKQAWESEKANPAVTWPDFSVIADVVYNLGLGGKSISCDADLSSDGLGSIVLHLKLVPAGDGYDAAASMEIYSLDEAGDTYSLDLHAHGDSFSGVFNAPDNTIALNAEWKTEEGAERLAAGLTVNEAEPGSILLTLVEGRLEGILTLREKEQARIAIESVEKEPILVITKE